MDVESIHEELIATIEALAEANLRAPVIVEGERDERSLRALGLAGDIVRVNSGDSIFHLAESLAGRHPEAIILTDWDRRGGVLARLLRDALEANGVRYDDDLRARIAVLCRKDIKDVESLAGHVERLSRQVASGWAGKDSKRWYGTRKSLAVREKRSRRIRGKKIRSRGP